MPCIFNVFLSFYSTSLDAVCEYQVSFGRYQADEQGWVDTIKSVSTGGTVRISTMDWLGQSKFTKQTVYWPSISSAISEVNSSHRLFHSSIMAF